MKIEKTRSLKTVKNRRKSLISDYHMIFLMEKFGDCDARLVLGGNSTLLVAKTFLQIGFVLGQRM